MPAIVGDITIQAGSYEPLYWTVTDPDTTQPVDLTAGYTVAGTVSTRRDGHGAVLLTLADTDFRRTTTGQVYYEPGSAVSAGWVFRFAHYQFELRHPSGQDVRFAEGRFLVSPEL